MKNILFLTSILAAGAIAPAFATESKVSVIPADVVTSIEELLARSRVSVGVSRESVITEMRHPNTALTPDVWVYTGFHANNLYNAERYDTLVVTFKNDRVVKITLTTAEEVRVAAARSGMTVQRIARR